MKANKFLAAITAMALLIGTAGCSANGGSDGKDKSKAGDIEKACETYVSKVLSGKDASKCVESGKEASAALSPAQQKVLDQVLNESSYKIKDSDADEKKGEGSVTVEIKYPDVKEIAEDYDDDEIEDIIDDIIDADPDEYTTDKFTVEFILEDDEWLVTDDSDEDFKAMLWGIVSGIGGTVIPDPSGRDTDPTSGGNDVDSFDITPSEVSQVTYTTYNDPSGYFTMEIPSGWAVETGLIPTREIDLISYAIRLYDPQNPDRMLYFNLNNAGILKSQDARDWYSANYGENSAFAVLPVATEISTKGYFEGYSGYYYYTDFELIDYVGQDYLGGDILSATATSTLSGGKIEGLFAATVQNFEYYVQRNMFDYTQGTVDVGLLIPYCIVMETAPEGEFLDWQPVLDHCFGTIQFSDAFMSQRQAQWGQTMATSEYIMNTANECSDMIMDSWERSSRTYDVESQKYSDATLGYERVYDTETGEYYRAENGFGDWYDGTRYQVVDTDEAYLSPVSGTINWRG